MKKKRKKIVLVCFILATLAWLLTMGLHSKHFVRTYCEGEENYDQPNIYVFMKPSYQRTGISKLYTSTVDILPYPLKILATIDDRTSGDGVVISSLIIKYDNNYEVAVIEPDCPRGGPFGSVFKKKYSKKHPDRNFRSAYIDINRAVWRRGSFKIIIKGHIYGDKNIPFEQHLKMDYSLEKNIYTGWELFLLSCC